MHSNQLQCTSPVLLCVVVLDVVEGNFHSTTVSQQNICGSWCSPFRVVMLNWCHPDAGRWTQTCHRHRHHHHHHQQWHQWWLTISAAIGVPLYLSFSSQSSRSSVKVARCVWASVCLFCHDPKSEQNTEGEMLEQKVSSSSSSSSSWNDFDLNLTITLNRTQLEKLRGWTVWVWPCWYNRGLHRCWSPVH